MPKLGGFRLDAIENPTWFSWPAVWPINCRVPTRADSTVITSPGDIRYLIQVIGSGSWLEMLVTALPILGIPKDTDWWWEG